MQSDIANMQQYAQHSFCFCLFFCGRSVTVNSKNINFNLEAKKHELA